MVSFDAPSSPWRGKFCCIQTRNDILAPLIPTYDQACSNGRRSGTVHRQIWLCSEILFKPMIKIKYCPLKFILSSQTLKPG